MVWLPATRFFMRTQKAVESGIIESSGANGLPFPGIGRLRRIQATGAAAMPGCDATHFGGR